MAKEFFFSSQEIFPILFSLLKHYLIIIRRSYNAFKIHGLDGRTINARASCAGSLEFKSRTGQSYIALQTVRHRFNIYASSCVALAL